MPPLINERDSQAARTERRRAVISGCASPMAGTACRHCPTEQHVDLVLNTANDRLRTRCDRSKILDVLEEKHGVVRTT